MATRYTYKVVNVARSQVLAGELEGILNQWHGSGWEVFQLLWVDANQTIVIVFRAEQ